MDSLEIITHGNGAILVDVFNAIGRIRTGNIINGAFIVMMISGYAFTLIQNIVVLNTKDIAKWTIAWTLIFGVVYQPTKSVLISDRVVGGQVVVDNIPLGLATFASITSQLGANLARVFEDQLQIPNEVQRYTNSGTLMASKLALAASEIHITTPHLEKSFRNFAFQCVMYDVRIGSTYTMDDLLYSNDIWRLIKESTSIVRMFEYHGKNREREILTCREGAAKLENELNVEAINSQRILGWRFFNLKGIGNKEGASPESNYINKIVKDYLPASHELLAHMSGQSTEILKKHMVMNIIRESPLIASQMMDVGAGAQGYAIARAKSQQQNTFHLLGAMAGSGVQYLMGLFEALFYGSFLLIILIAMMPGCHSVLLSYLTSLVWIQSWPTIYTIINFFMTANTIAASNATASYIAADGTQGIGWNLFTSPAIIQANLDQAALAGFYSLSVPFIAIAIVKGTGSFVHLAGHLTSISQSAASQAGEEMTTGNYALQNIQYANTSSFNMNANHWDSAPSYRARSSSYEMDSGSLMRVSGDGSAMLDQSQGMSQLLTNLHLGQSFSERKNNLMQEVQSAYQQAGMSYVDSIGASMSSTLQSMNASGKSISDGEHFSHSEQVGQMESLQKFDQLAEKLALHMGWSKDKSVNSLVGVSASLGHSGILSIPTKTVENILGAKLDIHGGTSLNFSKLDKETRDKVSDFIQSEGATSTIDQAVRATKDMSYHAGHDKQDRLSSELNSNFSKMHNHEKQFQASMQKMLSTQQSKEFSEANSTNIERNLNQDFVAWAKEQITQDGETLGIRGVDSLLRDPIAAEDYAQAFLDDRIQSLKSVINEDANYLVSQRYQKMSAGVERKNDLAYHDKTNQQTVLNRSEKNGLPSSDNLSIDSSPKNKFDDLTKENNELMHQAQDRLERGGQNVTRKVGNKVKISKKNNKEPA